MSAHNCNGAVLRANHMVLQEIYLENRNPIQIADIQLTGFHQHMHIYKNLTLLAWSNRNVQPMVVVHVLKSRFIH